MQTTTDLVVIVIITLRRRLDAGWVIFALFLFSPLNPSGTNRRKCARAFALKRFRLRFDHLFIIIIIITITIILRSRLTAADEVQKFKRDPWPMAGV